jgi:DNA-binding MarR family transcriptional regulator
MRCLCASLRQSARLLTRYYENELQAADLTPAQFELLATLAAHRGMVQSHLAETLGLDQTTLSRSMKVLIGRNWIRPAASPNDRRRVVYKISRTGKAVFRRALPHWHRAQGHMQEILGKDWKTVWSTIDRLTNAGRAAIDK